MKRGRPSRVSKRIVNGKRLTESEQAIVKVLEITPMTFNALRRKKLMASSTLAVRLKRLIKIGYVERTPDDPKIFRLTKKALSPVGKIIREFMVYGLDPERGEGSLKNKNCVDALLKISTLDEAETYKSLNTYLFVKSLARYYYERVEVPRMVREGDEELTCLFNDSAEELRRFYTRHRDDEKIFRVLGIARKHEATENLDELLCWIAPLVFLVPLGQDVRLKDTEGLNALVKGLDAVPDNLTAQIFNHELLRWDQYFEENPAFSSALKKEREVKNT